MRTWPRTILACALLAVFLGSAPGAAFAAADWAVTDEGFPATLTWDQQTDVFIQAANTGTTTWDQSYALMSVARPTGSVVSVDRWGLALVPQTGITPPVGPDGGILLEFGVVAPPITTVAYAPSADPTNPGAEASLGCHWGLARDDELVSDDLAGDEIVISRFPDIHPGTPGAWARFFVEECAGRVPYIVSGYQDGCYHPEYEVSRDQMAVFIARAAGYELADVTDDVFPDVPASHWAAREIAACVENGVVHGYPEGFYLPDQLVTRAQMAVYIARARSFELREPTAPPFEDISAKHWAESEIQACVENGVVFGFEDGAYQPEMPVARDQMAAYIWRAFIGPFSSPVILAGPGIVPRDPTSLEYHGWSSITTGDIFDPGYAYIAFDGTRLDSNLAADGHWDVTFALFNADSPTAEATAAVSMIGGDLAAAKSAALASGDPYFVLSWAIPAGLRPGDYTLVVTAEDAFGRLREVARQPHLTITSGHVLVLYDGSGPYGWIGEMHAQQLTNLLGHFPVTCETKPVEDYVPGEIDKAGATFYLGTIFDNTLPPAFLEDVMTTDRTICWCYYNLWQIAWEDPDFEHRFGIAFDGMYELDLDAIWYRGETLQRDVAEPEIGVAWPLDPDITAEAATACASDDPGEDVCVPYVLRGRNLWYVADIPFAYVGEEDRYLAFADLLHDMLGIDHPETHRALIRIEDVDPTASPDNLRAIADYLYSEGVPFAVSVIPVHYDPLGVYNGGVPSRIEMSDSPEFVSALHYMVERGGNIVMHGYTHQYDSVLNPYTAATRDDFEFYRVSFDVHGDAVFEGPVPEDSEEWVQTRLDLGLSEMSECGFEVAAWETPHYTASPLDYRVFAANFPLTTQRVFYSGYHEPTDTLYYLDQLFPYVIYADVYGQKIVPENIGHVDPFGWSYYGPRMPADVVRAAQKNLVVRDGWASAYFHPFLDLDLLRDLVEGIEDLGYTFVPLVAVR